MSPWQKSRVPGAVPTCLLLFQWQQKRLSSREHLKCIQYLPGPGGLCNTLTAATGGSDQGWERFKENRAHSDILGCPRSGFVGRCSSGVA